MESIYNKRLAIPRLKIQQIFILFFIMPLVFTAQKTTAKERNENENIIQETKSKNTSFSTEENIEVFPVPSCYTVNEIYSMRVKPANSDEWTDVPLIDHTPRGSLNCTYGNFYFTDTVMVEITKTSSINNYSISPKSLQLASDVNDSILSFTLTSPEYLMTTIDGTDIIVLADTIAESKPSSSGSGIFNVTASPYNADNTGETIVTDKIQQAIDDASAYSDGTGIVYIPEGVYSITRLNAKSNIEIYLEGGAVLRGTGNPEDYNEYIPGGNTDYSYCIHAENQSNFKVWGPGTIDANGVLLTELTDPNTQPGDISNATMKIRALSIHNCSNINISNIIAREGSSWTVSLYDSDNIDISKVKVINERVLKHNDGIDLSACQHGRVKDCFILTSDDALCAKGTQDNNEDCYDLRFEDIVVYSNTRGVKCGMQAYKHMYDIWFIDIDVINARYGIDLLHQDGVGLWEDIHFIDIRVENLQYFVPSTPAPIVASVRDGGPVRNVEITNCSFDEWGEKNSRIVGHEHGWFNNIIFTNLKIAGELIHNKEEAHMDLNAFTKNIIFQVGDFDSIVFPEIDTAEYEEKCFSFEPEDYADQESFAPFFVAEDTAACQGKYIESNETNQDLGVDGKIVYEFTTAERDNFFIWFRVIAPNDTDDSFWVVMDGEPHKFNSITPSNEWVWDLVKDSDTGADPLVFDLEAGDHTFEIIRRESHAKLDKVYITNQIYSIPEDCEECNSSGTSSNREYALPIEGTIIRQNPVDGILIFDSALITPGDLKVFDLQGRQVKSFHIYETSELDVSGLECGIYLLNYTNESSMISQKIVIK